MKHLFCSLFIEPPISKHAYVLWEKEGGGGGGGVEDSDIKRGEMLP